MRTVIITGGNSGLGFETAKKIAKDFSCELVKIEPDIVYGGFLSSCARVISERLKKDLPTYVTEIPDLSEIDTVFVRAFLQDCDLEGKRVIPFATSRMTGIEGAVETLTMICGGASVEHPFFYSPRKKDNYKAWRAEVSAAPAEEAAEEAAPEE